jgi:GxxExxY protein
VDILYKALSHQIVGCVFDVFRDIGPGLDEFTYHQGLKVCFGKKGWLFISKPHIQVVYRNVKIAELEPDFIVDDKIILELKAIQREFLPENYTQVISYLCAAGKCLEILINFGLLKAKFTRVPFSKRPLKIVEDFEKLNTEKQNAGEELWRLRDSVIKVANELGLGYDGNIYKEAMKVELRLNGFSFNEKAKVAVNYQDSFLSHYEIDCWLINERFLFGVFAGSKQVRAYDILRMSSYLRKLKLNIGLITFWGKDHLKILGVSPGH